VHADAERVAKEDHWAWQRLGKVWIGGVTVKGSLVTTVTSNRVALCAIRPFRPLAQVRPPGGAFTCAETRVDARFMARVFGGGPSGTGGAGLAVDASAKPVRDADCFIVCGDEDGSVHVAQARDGELLVSLVCGDASPGAVTALSLHVQNERGTTTNPQAIAAYHSGWLVLWDLGPDSLFDDDRNGPPVVTRRTAEEGSGGSSLCIWPLAGAPGGLPRELHEAAEMTCMSVWEPPLARKLSPPQGPMIATGAKDGRVQVWGAHGGSLDQVADADATILFGHTKSASSVYVFSDTLLVTGGADMDVRVWDPKRVRPCVHVSRVRPAVC
ncbi:hypothetical protein T484DRAFT_1763459, partial [Baffinella frigidus]